MKFLLAILLAFASSAFAQQYPSKPVRLVIHFPAGGSTDVVTRILAQALTESMGQPFVVENKLGADGAIAAAQVMQSAPDGYTLFLATNTPMMQVPLLKKEPPYDPVTAFTPVSLVGRYTFVLVTSPALPAKTMSELIAYARANPGKVNLGFPFVYARVDLAGEEIAHCASEQVVFAGEQHQVGPSLSDD